MQTCILCIDWAVAGENDPDLHTFICVHSDYEAGETPDRPLRSGNTNILWEAEDKVFDVVEKLPTFFFQRRTSNKWFLKRIAASFPCSKCLSTLARRLFKKDSILQKYVAKIERRLLV